MREFGAPHAEERPREPAAAALRLLIVSMSEDELVLRASE
jgi:hypothetical protein